MAVYSIPASQSTLTTTYKTMATILCAGSAPRRFKVFDLNMAAGSAPASTDTNIQFDLSICTAEGTGTTYTPLPNDPADAAALSTSKINHTVEPTITATTSRFNIAMNQRAPFRWQTYLGSGAEITAAATASQGHAFRALSAGYTGAAGGSIYYQEQ
jgi:hypothetical protein